MNELHAYALLSILILTGCAHSRSEINLKSPPPSVTTLKEAAALSGRSLGVAVGAERGVPDLTADSRLARIIAREFSVLATENALKIRDLQPKQRGSFDFRDGDTIAKFAKDHGMTVRGTPFVWHKGLPPWLKNGTFSGQELEQILRDHVFKVATHYKSRFPGIIRHWDVVNEAIGRDGGLRQETLWKSIGKSPGDYIPLAFRWAHEADKDLVLFYNDYGIEELNSKSDGVYQLLKSLLAQGVPVHGIGFQMHLSEAESIDFESMSRNFDRFAALGLQIDITEFDNRLRLPASGALSSDQLDYQAANYARVAQLCVSRSACRMLVVWGVTDRYDYVPEEEPGFGKGFMLDENERPKPAYSAFLRGLLPP